jgi:hypothetical protein
VTGCNGVAPEAGASSVGAAGAGGVTVSVAVRDVPANVLVMLAEVEVATEEVVIVNFALVAPAATVTLAGTLTTAELSDSVTIVPPAGAAALRVTVPLEELPPTTLVGFSDTADSVGPTGGGFTPIAENWNTLSRAAES